MEKVKQPIVTMQCKECDYKAKSKGDFERHRSCHDKKSAYQCRWCSFSVESLLPLSLHVDQCHVNKTRNESPPDSSVKQKTAQRHVSSTSGIKTNRFNKSCSFCDYKTTVKYWMDRHIQRMHPSPNTPIIQPAITTNKDDDSYKFFCAHCSYKTRIKIHLERHDACHQNAHGKHQCPSCSYSVNGAGVLAAHIDRHHPRIIEKNDSNHKKRAKDAEPKRNNALLITCRSCKNFQTTCRFTLKRHIKKAHPFSLSALPPLSNHKVVGKTRQPSNPVIREEWYVSPIGKKTKYIYCGDCNFRTIYDYNLKRHAERKHPSSTMKNLVQPPREAWTMLRQCALCDFRTTYRYNLKRHLRVKHPSFILANSVQLPKPEACAYCEFSSTDERQLKWHLAFHQNKSEHQCTICSYSGSTTYQLRIHLARHHKGIPNKPWMKCSMCSFQAEKAKKLRNHLVYHRIKSRFQCQLCSYSVKTNLNLKVHVERHHPPSSVITKSKELNLLGKPSLLGEETGKIQSLQSRIKTMEERSRLAEEEVTQILSKKMDVQEKIDGIAERLDEMALDVEEGHMLMKQEEEKIKSLEDEMDVIDSQLDALNEEEESLAQDLEEAEGSHFGIVQVIEALRSELEELLSDNV